MFLGLWIVLLLAMICEPVPASVVPLIMVVLAGNIEPYRGWVVTYASSFTWFGVYLCKGNGAEVNQYALNSSKFCCFSRISVGRR